MAGLRLASVDAEQKVYTFERAPAPGGDADDAIADLGRCSFNEGEMVLLSAEGTLRCDMLRCEMLRCAAACCFAMSCP